MSKITKPVFVAWTNTDLTEGRGNSVPLAVCSLESTAIRLGQGKNVQGSDCNITKETAVKVDGKWLAPARIIFPTKEDEQRDLEMNERTEATRKAKAAGLSDEDIKALRG